MPLPHLMIWPPFVLSGGGLVQDVACLVADLEAENSWAAKTTALLSINDEGGETPPQMGGEEQQRGPGKTGLV